MVYSIHGHGDFLFYFYKCNTENPELYFLTAIPLEVLTSNKYSASYSHSTLNRFRSNFRRYYLTLSYVYDKSVKKTQWKRYWQSNSYK